MKRHTNRQIINDDEDHHQEAGKIDLSFFNWKNDSGLLSIFQPLFLENTQNARGAARRTHPIENARDPPLSSTPHQKTMKVKLR